MVFFQTAMLFVVQLFCAMDRDEDDSITSITTVLPKNGNRTEPAAAH